MKSTPAIVLFVLTLLTTDMFGQAGTMVHGIVTDGHRNRLLGINVMIKGTPVSSITDTCGHFSIPADGDKFTLMFHGMSYNDMKAYEIEITKNDMADTLVFQLGHLKAINPDCEKIDKRIKRKVIE